MERWDWLIAALTILVILGVCWWLLVHVGSHY